MDSVRAGRLEEGRSAPPPPLVAVAAAADRASGQTGSRIARAAGAAVGAAAAGAALACAGRTRRARLTGHAGTTAASLRKTPKRESRRAAAAAAAAAMAALAQRDDELTCEGGGGHYAAGCFDARARAGSCRGACTTIRRPVYAWHLPHARAVGWGCATVRASPHSWRVRQCVFWIDHCPAHGRCPPEPGMHARTRPHGRIHSGDGCGGRESSSRSQRRVPERLRPEEREERPHGAAAPRRELLPRSGLVSRASAGCVSSFSRVAALPAWPRPAV